MKRTALLIIVMVVVLLSVAAAAARPLPPPLSPDEAEMLRAYPELAQARAAGTSGIVIAGVDTFGCTSGTMKIRIGLVLDKPGSNYTLSILVTGAGTHMNDRTVGPRQSGIQTVTLATSTTGGPAAAGFPLPAGSQIQLRMVLSRENGEPLWMARTNVADCDGVPNTTSFHLSQQMIILNKNPRFVQNDPNDPTKAAKWTTLGKVRRSCSADVCTMTLTGKPDKTATLSSKTKLKPNGQSMVVNVLFLSDASAASGPATIQLRVYNDDNETTTTSSPANISTLLVSQEHYMMGGFNMLDTNKVELDISFGPSGVGKLKFKAIYIFGFVSS